MNKKKTKNVYKIKDISIKKGLVKTRIKKSKGIYNDLISYY